MRLTLKAKIWITVLTIVMMFAFFILFYFPAQQEQYLLKNYNKEVQNLATTVALGVEVALDEQNFELVGKSLQYVRGDPRLRFIALIESDTIRGDSGPPHVEKKIFKTYPEGLQPRTDLASSDSFIVKYASFSTDIMSGDVMLVYTTREIVHTKRQIRITSIVVSLIVFIIGILIGFWLARNISVPVLALRDAANKVGEGDLTQRVSNTSKDEIGELGKAFNKMVDDLAKAQKQVFERTKDLVEEKKKSDELLLNILPSETAEELKRTGTAKAKNYSQVTVLFADFKGFTKISERLSPDKLVAELNYFFTAFDAIIQKYNIEKIKTIGDAYMCAGGLPIPNQTHAADVVKAAMEMRNFTNNYKSTNGLTEIIYEMRIGVHSGPVVAGIVGSKKFAYDIWGDTVNIASRMETCSEPSKINISGATFDLVKDEFDCTYRGKINAKNKGEIDMYFVNKIRVLAEVNH